MATVTELKAISTNSNWIFRVNYYLIKTAMAVFVEDAGTANHANRLAFARATLKDQLNINKYALAVLTNATIAAKADPLQSTDAEIEYAVATEMYNTFAATLVV